MSCQLTNPAVAHIRKYYEALAHLHAPGLVTEGNIREHFAELLRAAYGLLLSPPHKSGAPFIAPHAMSGQR